MVIHIWMIHTTFWLRYCYQIRNTNIFMSWPMQLGHSTLATVVIHIWLIPTMSNTYSKALYFRHIYNTDDVYHRISVAFSIWWLRIIYFLSHMLLVLFNPLNNHLFSYIHVLDSPSNACGYIRENNKHFLLDSPLFINEGTAVLHQLDRLGFSVSIRNLLYGNTQYSEQLSIEIIHDFIEWIGQF